MAHSKTKNWIHLIFSTKNRMPFISEKIESYVHDLLKQELRRLNCPLDSINGMPDHVHILFLLHPQKSLSDVVRQLKGGSSHTINDGEALPVKFSWSPGYAAYSVSESVVPVVRNYIAQQKAHHADKSYDTEFLDFLQVHGLDQSPEP